MRKNPALLLKMGVLLALSGGLFGCSERMPTEGGGIGAYNLITATDRGGGNQDINGVTALVVENRFGPVSVEAESRLGSMRWFLDSHVAARTRNRAEAELANVAIDWRVELGTLYATVLAPPRSDTLQATVGIFLGLPPDRSVRVIYADGAVFASFMGASFTVEEATHVELAPHSGPCQIRLIAGNVQGLLALPRDATCTATTGNGDIDLRVSRQTQAQVVLETSRGVTRIEGLAVDFTEQRPTRITGKLGDGRGLLSLRTGQGNVTLRPE